MGLEWKINYCPKTVAWRSDLTEGEENNEQENSTC